MNSAIRWMMVGGLAQLAMVAAWADQVRVAEPSQKASLPLVIYGDADDAGLSYYTPAGWMGNVEALEVDESCAEQPHSGASCIKVSYYAFGQWAGIAWQSEANDWGDEPGGYDLTGAKKLTFWARGDQGGELVEFKMGILKKSKPFHDTASASLGRIRLTPEWQQYAVPLEGKDLTRTKTGFVFALSGQKEPVTFFLDDIRYE